MSHLNISSSSSSRKRKRQRTPSSERREISMTPPLSSPQQGTVEDALERIHGLIAKTLDISKGIDTDSMNKLSSLRAALRRPNAEIWFEAFPRFFQTYNPKHIDTSANWIKSMNYALYPQKQDENHQEASRILRNILETEKGKAWAKFKNCPTEMCLKNRVETIQRISLELFFGHS